MDSLQAMALIPARGGSKRLPGKNIYPFAGEPLIVHTIRQALAARHVARVIVSTDDEDIARVSRDAGAETPFMRPAEISGPTATLTDALKHAILWLEDHEGWTTEYSVLLQPTTPVRPPGLIDQCIQALEDEPEADSLITVVPAPRELYAAYWSWWHNGKYLEPVVKDPATGKRFQAQTTDGPRMLETNGYVTVHRRSVVLTGNDRYGERIVPFTMPAGSTVDIDDEEEFRKAERLFLDRLDAESSG